MIDPVNISVGIVTYQSHLGVFEELLDSLIRAIELLRRTRMVDAAIYVVSNDEDPEEAQGVAHIGQRFASRAANIVRYELIHGHGNVGYGAGQNLALERIRSDYHVVLNPDVVLDEAALVESVHFLEEHGDTAMIVPQGFDAADRYACLAKRGPSVLVLLLRALSVGASEGVFGRRVGNYIYNDLLPSDQPQAIQHASGCFMCCRSSALRSVGGFDGRYFLYFEDYDLSRRIADHGSIYELPGVKIHHHGGRTARRGWRRISYFLRSACVFFHRYGWRLM